MEIGVVLGLESGEDRKVVGWKPMGARNCRSDLRVGRGYD